MAEIRVEAVGEDAASFPREIEAILDQAAVELGKPFKETPLNLRALDAKGNFLGGLAGYALQGWFYVRLLAVTPQARGKGAGRALMAAAEQAARDKGLAGVYVDTFDFQAPRFYAGIDYAEIGRLPAVGEHPARIWFAKRF